MDQNNSLQNNFNDTGLNINNTQPPTMEQSDYAGFFFATDDNGSSTTYTPYATDNNHEQLGQRPEQSTFSFTNNETQSLSYMPQHQYTNQNPSLSLNDMTIGSSQANNSESVFSFEVPGFKIKII